MDFDILKAALGSVHNTADGQFYGVFSGFCVSNEDPLKLGRIKVYIPNIHGKAQPDLDTLNWCWPCFNFGGNAQMGTVLIPDEGAGVWVLFENGDTQHPIYIGVWYGSPDSTSELPDKAYEGNSPAYHVLFRYGNMSIYFKKDGQEAIINVTDDTSITLLDTGQIEVKAKSGIVNVQDDHINLTQNSGSSIDINGDTITITAVNININGFVNFNA